MSGQNAGHCEVRSVGSSGDMSSQVTRMGSVALVSKSQLDVGWEVARGEIGKRNGRVPILFFNSPLCSTLGHASCLASSKQVLLCCHCSAPEAATINYSKSNHTLFKEVLNHKSSSCSGMKMFHTCKPLAFSELSTII